MPPLNETLLGNKGLKNFADFVMRTRLTQAHQNHVTVDTHMLEKAFHLNRGGAHTV